MKRHFLLLPLVALTVASALARADMVVDGTDYAEAVNKSTAADALLNPKALLVSRHYWATLATDYGVSSTPMDAYGTFADCSQDAKKLEAQDRTVPIYATDSDGKSVHIPHYVCEEISSPAQLAVARELLKRKL